METNFYTSYLNDNKTLARTIVVKSNIARDKINEFVRLKYGSQAVDDSNPHSWKYYLNISGEYHPTDTLMTVVSLDTLETIQFTKQNLAIHTATKKAYGFGTRYYIGLVEQYKDQEQLILGILYPADLDRAIESEEGTILAYPASLVEPQESSLIQELEDFIKRWLLRWEVKLFHNTDSLYAASVLAFLYVSIYYKLLNLRIKRCKTEEVHSFHLREYLASHFDLDEYIPYMTDKQKMWLYRNIRYIARHHGSVEMFKTLVEKLLTDRRIPLNEFSVRQSSNFDGNYSPIVNIRRSSINGDWNVPLVSQFSFEELMNYEAPLAYGNPAEIKESSSNIYQKLQLSTSSVIRTKDLESRMVDYSDSVPEPLMSVLFRLWISSSLKGLYDVNIRFRDPKTSIDHSLFAKDALIYYVYIALNAHGMYQGQLPSITNLRQWKMVKPTQQQLLDRVDSRTYPDLKNVAKRLSEGLPAMHEVVSSTSFFEFGFSLYEESLFHWYLTSNTEEMYERGYVENMVNGLYVIEDHELDLEGMSVNAWLGSRNLPVYDLTVPEAELLMLEIFQTSVGWNIDKTKQLKYIQKAMIDILRKLSSYTIQIVRDINDSTIVPINWPNVRPGNIISQGYNPYYIPNRIQVFENFGHGTSLYDLDNDSNISEGNAETYAQQLVEIDLPSEIVLEAGSAENVILRQSVPLFEMNDISNLDLLSAEELFKIKTPT